jgi:hypothetical protein
MTLSNSERQYLDELQRDVNDFDARLKEFDRIVGNQHEDPYLRGLFDSARGQIAGEITQRVRSWRRFTYEDPAKVALLKI